VSRPCRAPLGLFSLARPGRRRPPLPRASPSGAALPPARASRARRGRRGARFSAPQPRAYPRPHGPGRHRRRRRAAEEGHRRARDHPGPRRLRRRWHLRHGALRPRAADDGRRGAPVRSAPHPGRLRPFRRRHPGRGRDGRHADPHRRLRNRGARVHRPRACRGYRRHRHRPPHARRHPSRRGRRGEPQPGGLRLSRQGARGRGRGVEGVLRAGGRDRLPRREAVQLPGPGGHRHHRRRGAAGGREPRAGALGAQGAARNAQPRPARPAAGDGADGQGRDHLHPGRVPARAPHQRRRTDGRGAARREAAADGRSARGRRDRPVAGVRQPLAADGGRRDAQAGDGGAGVRLRSRSAVRRGAGARRMAPGRHRHRGVAAGGAPPSPRGDDRAGRARRRKGKRALHLALSPVRRHARLRPSPGALRRPPRGGRVHHPPRERRRLSRSLQRRRARRADGRRPGSRGAHRPGAGAAPRGPGPRPHAQARGPLRRRERHAGVRGARRGGRGPESGRQGAPEAHAGRLRRKARRHRLRDGRPLCGAGLRGVAAGRGVQAGGKPLQRPDARAGQAGGPPPGRV
ncbi:MAG: RecJ, partial [uncultured Gemmatimonadetes bacterium]